MTQGASASAGDTPKLGRYRLLDEIGRGGMGVVYRALDPSIGRTVAVKTVRLSEHGSQEEVEALRMRLLRESQAAGQLSHPHIVPIFDYGEQQDVAYIVMEYISGRTLERALEEDPAIRSSSAALEILAVCARALDYAHSKGIVHRDVKPGNIMLQDDGTVKIADFGIAKMMHAGTLTTTAMMVGSPYYMAPEQLKTEAVSGRTDQYALASVAYAMLTGRRPFEADSMATLISRTLFEDPPAAPSLNPALDSQVDAVLRKALAKDPAARYGSCTEFVDALRTACAAPSVAPGEDTASTRLALPVPERRTKRRVPLIMGAVLILLALASAAAVYYYQGVSKVAPPLMATSQPAAARSESIPAAKNTPLKTQPAPPPAPQNRPVQSTVQKPPAEACKPGLVELATDRFQACADTLAQRGFSPAALAAYENDGTTSLMTAFQPPANRRATFLTSGRDRPELVRRMANDGYRPDGASVLDSGDLPRFSEIWVPRRGKFEARVFFTRQDFDDVRKAHETDGFMMIDLVPFRFKTETRYAAIWVKESGLDSKALLDLTAPELSQRTQTLNQQGYRVSRISTYHSDSGRRFAAVWQRPQGGAIWQINLSRENLFKMHAENLANGYHLHHISYNRGAFAAVWWN